MAQVVLIKIPAPVAEVGDLVEMKPDSVELSGPGYEDFTILQFAMSVISLREIIRDKQPEIRDYRKVRRIEVETSPGIYEEILRDPKYRCNFDALTAENIEELKTSDKARSTAIFNNRLVSCVIKQLPSLRV